MRFVALCVTVLLKMLAIHSPIYSSDAPMVSPAFPEEGRVIQKREIRYVGREAFASPKLARPRINLDAPRQCVHPPET